MPPITRRPLLPLLLLFTLFCATVVLAAERAPTAPAAALGRYILAHERSGSFGYGNIMVVDPDDGRIYRTGAGQQELIIIDPHPTPTYEMITLPFGVAHLAMSQDGDRLFLANLPTSPIDHHIAVFDMASQTITSSFDYTCEGIATCDLLSIAPGPDDRLYLAFDYSAAIDVYDTLTGQRLTRFDHPDGAPRQIVTQGHNLYTVAGPQAVERNRLRRFDISDVTPVLETTVPPPIGEAGFGPLALAADPNGAYVVLWQDNMNRALRLDPLSLAVTGEYLLPRDATVWSVLISPTGDEVTLIRNYPDAYTFDADSGALRRFINPDLTYSADGYVVLPDHYLANFTQDQLRVLQANDHLAFAPMLFANYCGGLFIDDFSDPTSGWPIADRGTVAYYYDHNQYNDDFYAILHRVPDAWSAVSRGDTWQEWPSLSVMATAGPGVGSAGLIFGLNDDWSHFYSFEIIPEVGRWVLYFYMDGWHIWATDEYDYISSPGTLTRLSLVPTADGQLELQIGYHTVFTFPEVPQGRVGLSGGSFYQGVGHSYDDFTIEPGPNCRPSTRTNGAAIERSPLLPPPPLPATP